MQVTPQGLHLRNFASSIMIMQIFIPQSQHHAVNLYSSGVTFDAQHQK